MNHDPRDHHNMHRFRLVDSDLAGNTNDSWGVELVLRALAGSRAPILPTPDGLLIDYAQYHAYWHGLHFLAVARLGWRDPGKGFRAWYESGRPAIDPTLDFIESVWGRDKTLDIYVAWATNQTYQFKSCNPNYLAPNDHWIEWARRVPDEPKLRLLDGSLNPPHLGEATEQVHNIYDQGQDSALLIADSSKRRAVFVTGEVDMYSDLMNRWKELPKVDPANWRVDVFNRRLGFIGQYRQSRTTGRLHVGKHSIHMMGN